MHTGWVTMQVLDVDMWQRMLCTRVIAIARLHNIAMHLHMHALHVHSFFKVLSA